MTVTSTNALSGPHVADGTNRSWPFNFKLLNVAHLQLQVSDPDGSNLQVISTGFTVDPAYIGNDAGGYVTYPVLPALPLTAGKVVRPFRSVDYTQPNKIGNQQGFFPKTHEDTFDLLEMQIQQNRRDIDRSWKSPFGSVGGSIIGGADNTLATFIGGELVGLPPYSGGSFTVLPISAGGTGATTPGDALSALGAASTGALAAKADVSALAAKADVSALAAYAQLSGATFTSHVNVDGSLRVGPAASSSRIIISANALPGFTSTFEFFKPDGNLKAYMGWDDGTGTSMRMFAEAGVGWDFYGAHMQFNDVNIATEAYVAAQIAANPSQLNENLAYGAIGQYVFGSTGTTAATAGSTYAGSIIRPSGVSTSVSAYAVSTNGAAAVLSGTWRALGTSVYFGSYTQLNTLFVRIS